MPSGSYHRILLLLILGCTFYCYAPALRNGFTYWDDTAYVLDNPAVQAFDAAHLGAIFGSTYQGNYIPVTFLSFAAEKAVFGSSPQVFIGMNIFFHLLNTLLVFVFVRMLLGRHLPACICALLFGVHTLHVESVAWIAERKDVLYTLYFLLALICYLRFLDRRKTSWFVLCLLCMLLSVLSKSMGVMVAFTLPLIDLYKGRTWSRQVILEKVPFLVLAGVFTLVGVLAVQTPAGQLCSFHPGFAPRVALACYAFFAYLSRLVLPVGLSAYYPYPMLPTEAVPGWVWIFPVLMAVLLFLLFRFRHKPVLVFGALFYAVNIFLALQLFPVGDALMGDRFTYLASLGLFIPLGQVFWNLFECKKQRLLPLAVLGAYTVFLVGATRMRCEVWKNADTLWGDVLRHYDQVPLAHVNRGNSYFQQGNATAAIGEFSKAIALGYDLDMAYYNRGVAFFSTKQYDRAAADFSVVLKYSKDDKDALLSRAISYIHLDRKKESLADFDHYIALDSMNADAYAKRGVMRIQTGDSTGACMDWQRAVKLGSKETLQVLDLYCK